MSSLDPRSPELAETILSRRTATAELPRITVVLRWSIGVIGVAVLGWLLLMRPPATLRDFWFFAAAIVGLQTFLAVRTAPSARFHLGFTFLFVYFQLAGGIAAAILIVVDRFVSWGIQLVRRERSETFLAMFFEVGMNILSTLAGALLTGAVLRIPVMQLTRGAPPFQAMGMFAAGFFLVNSALTSVAVYSRFGFSDLRTRLWPATVFWMGISVVASLPLAIITWTLAGQFGEVGAALIMFGLAAALSLILKLNSGLVKINNEQRAVNRIGNLLNSTLSTRELFTIVATETRQVLPWDRFFIALANREGSIDLVYVDASGSQTAPRTVPSGVGLTGRAMASGEVVHFEIERPGSEHLGEFESTTGRRKPRSIIVAPMRFGDRMIGAIGIQSFRPDSYGRGQFRLLETIAAQAATAIRNAQLFESERQANKERDEFISLVTHEIKSPLTSISGYTDLARDGIGEGEHGQVRDYLGVIKGEARKILRLVEDLLDASRMDAGHFTIEPERTDLERIVVEVVERYRRTCSQAIELRKEGAVPPLQADPVRIDQVIDNLVSNACKYSKPDSTIVVTLADRTDTAQIIVSDDGDGIEPSKLPRLFERFYRAGMVGGGSAKGTGLGLYITKQIVEMHGGTIEVESGPGVGTTFTVELPIRLDS